MTRAVHAVDAQILILLLASSLRYPFKYAELAHQIPLGMLTLCSSIWTLLLLLPPRYTPRPVILLVSFHPSSAALPPSPMRPPKRLLLAVTCQLAPRQAR